MDQRLPSTTIDSNLTLNGEKCIFSASEVEFGLSPEGLSPLHSNVEAIQRLPCSPALPKLPLSWA